MRVVQLIAGALFAAAATAAAGPTSCAVAQDHTMRPAAPRPGTMPPGDELAAIRAATAKYRDLNVALAEGYIRDPQEMCVTSVMEGWPRQLGGMGVHYFRPDLLGITGTEPRVSGTGMHQDFLKPAALVYEPQPDGSHELVAVENLVWAEPWRAAGNREPPAYYGFEYYYLHDNSNTESDEAHGFEPHYELHIWLYRDNPNGMFAPFNPNVSCEAHRKR